MKPVSISIASYNIFGNITLHHDSLPVFRVKRSTCSHNEIMQCAFQQNQLYFQGIAYPTVLEFFHLQERIKFSGKAKNQKHVHTPACIQRGKSTVYRKKNPLHWNLYQRLCKRNILSAGLSTICCYCLHVQERTQICCPKSCCPLK